MRKLPPLRALQTFEAFGRLGSVAAAAAELGVSSGAVSQQLRRAEEAVGVRLLERRGRGIGLTSRGRRYFDDLASGFDLIRLAQLNIEAEKSENTLLISCLPSLASKWIGSALLDWQERNPQASVRLIGEEAEPRFGDKRVDLRISYGGKADSFDNYAELFTDWVVPACSPGFLRQNPVSAPSDILAYPLLGIEWDPDQGAAPDWRQWAAHIGARYQPASGEVAFSLSSAAIDAAINGRGFVLAQLSMATNDLARGRLVAPCDSRVEMSVPYFLAWDRAVMEKPFGRELRAWIVATARRTQASFATLALEPSRAPPRVL